MKPTRAVLDAIAAAERDGRVASSVAVNPATLAGAATPFQELSGESEAEFQARVIAFAEGRGWRVVHTRRVRVQRKNGVVYYETPYQGMFARGVPDLELVRERIVKAELKVKKNTRDADQLAWAEAYQKAGVEYYCWKPCDFKLIAEVLS